MRNESAIQFSIETAINAYDQQDVEKANTSSPSTDSMKESEVQLLIHEASMMKHQCSKFLSSRFV